MLWLVIASTAIEVVITATATIYRSYRSQRLLQQQINNNPLPPSPRQLEHSNMVCPICCKTVEPKLYEMPCGHRCHYRCYADRLLERRDTEGAVNMPCDICGDLGLISDVNHLNDNVSDSSSYVSANSLDFEPYTEDADCAYCHQNLSCAEEEKEQLECGHFVHSFCRIDSSIIQQCGICITLEQENMKCSLCDILFQDTDPDREQLDCGHLIHRRCDSIRHFCPCTNCPRDCDTESTSINC